MVAGGGTLFENSPHYVRMRNNPRASEGEFGRVYGISGAQVRASGGFFFIILTTLT